MVSSDRTGSNGHKLKQEVPPQDEEEFLYDKGGRAPQQAAQGECVDSFLAGDIPNPLANIPASPALG